MQPPAPRGPLSERVLAALASPPPAPRLAVTVPEPAQPLADDDFQLALFVLYELHYAGIEGVDDRWEWSSPLLALRGELEAIFVDAVRMAAGPIDAPAPAAMPAWLAALEAADDGPSLSRWLARHGALAEFREFAIHRSIYQLREGDPHTWAIPRLAGRAKAALIEIQCEEYGFGRPGRLHSDLFGATLRALGLRDEPGAYVDAVGAPTLAAHNLMSLFGLHRRWRGAAIGHLAFYEMTSALPMRRYAETLRRLDVGPEATRFYDQHVLADAVHEQVGVHDMAGGLALAEPDLVPDICLGAAALAAAERALAADLIGAWEAGASSLRADQVVPAA